jgi:hypothetical protein
MKKKAAKITYKVGDMFREDTEDKHGEAKEYYLVA